MTTAPSDLRARWLALLHKLHADGYYPYVLDDPYAFEVVDVGDDGKGLVFHAYFRRGERYCCGEPGCHFALVHPNWNRLRKAMAAEGIHHPDPIRIREWRVTVEAGSVFHNGVVDSPGDETAEPYSYWVRQIREQQWPHESPFLDTSHNAISADTPAATESVEPPRLGVPGSAEADPKKLLSVGVAGSTRGLLRLSGNDTAAALDLILRGARSESHDIQLAASRALAYWGTLPAEVVRGLEDELMRGGSRRRLNALYVIGNSESVCARLEPVLIQVWKSFPDDRIHINTALGSLRRPQLATIEAAVDVVMNGAESNAGDAIDLLRYVNASQETWPALLGAINEIDGKARILLLARLVPEARSFGPRGIHAVQVLAANSGGAMFVAAAVFLLQANVENAPLGKLRSLLEESTDPLVLGQALSLVALAGRDDNHLLDLLHSRRETMPAYLRDAVKSVRERFAR